MPKRKETMNVQDDDSTPLKEVTTDRNYYGKMLDALEQDDPVALKSAVGHLSLADINRCFTHKIDDVFSIAASSLPLPVQEDLSQQDMANICPVHYATMKGDKLCLEVLLEAGADPNIKDSFGQTALHILPKCGWKNTHKDFKGCLEVLLDQGNTRRNRLDLSKCTPLSRAEEFQWSFMIGKMRELGQDKESSSKEYEGETALDDTLLKLLLEYNFEKFKNTLDAINASGNDIDTIINKSHGSYTLLQYACRCGKVNFVDELLKHKASPTCKDEANILSPVMWATKYGYHKILQKLIQDMTREDLQNGAIREHSDSLETPLHFLLKCENSQKNNEVNYYRCLKILLDKKEYIDLDAKDGDSNTALHFAGLCSDLRSFSTLLKNGANCTIKNIGGVCAMQSVRKDGMMTILDDCIEYSSNKKLIDTDFWISLNYKMMDIKDDTIQIENDPIKNEDDSNNCPKKHSSKKEMFFLNSLAGIFKDKDILYHPLLDIFIYLKWQNIKRYFYLNFVIHVVCLMLLVTYVCIYHSSLQAADIKNESVISKENKYLRIFFIVSLLATLCLREITQLLMTKSWKDYLNDMKNIIEVVNIVLIFILLCVPFDANVKMGIAAWIILFAFLEFVLNLGRFPIFAVYVTMFNTIAWNFFKFIGLFSIIILAFSFSFYLMFQSSESFRTFPESILKTIVMTTGEVDYSDLPVSSFPVASHILMVLFIFLILLVLVNLLNGLAISDIQVVQKKAEVISCMSFIDRAAQLEKAFYCTNSRNPFNRIRDALFGGTLTFVHCIPNHQLVIYINRHPIQYSLSDGTEGLSICNCHSFKLRGKQIEDLKRIVMVKKNAESYHCDQTYCK